LPVRDIPVVIHAEDTDFWASIGNFFKEESTKWILSVLLVPIFLGWYNARMRHNFESKSRRSEKEKEAAAARQDTAGTAVQNVTDTQGSA
jgi:hypothetical protein